jgi:hypothetical protein
MMSIRTCVTLVLALVAGNTALSAQTAPAPTARPDSAGCCQAANPAKPDCMMQGRAGMGTGMAMGMQNGMSPTSMMQMPMPTAADDARLDSLMSVLHQTKGDHKVAVMERVLDELLTQRAVMHEHMRQMMGGQH